MTQQLAVYEHAREALAAAVRFDEVTQIHSAAEKAEAYARIAKDRKLQADAAEIVARAERKLGIMLRQAKDGGLLSKGGRPSNSNVSEPETGADTEPVFDNTPFTLAEIGVDKKLSSRAQKAAELDEETFESAVTETRGKIEAADAPVVRAPRPKPVKAPKPEPVKALEPRKWHQFTFSVLALCMRSDRVGSAAILKLAEFTGVLERDGDAVDFTPEAIEAMGSLATAALKALDGEQNTQEGSGTAREASGGQPLAEQSGSGSGPGQSQGDIGGLKHGTQSAPHPQLAKIELREAYEGEVALLAPHKGKLTMKQAEAAMRAGYAAEVPLVLMVEDLGHPHGTIATWANRLGLTNPGRMHATQKRFGGDE
ncbi:MAG: hypothetical protein KIT02_10415 [Devosia sp.]|uniref:hypothetical protein n=1 Tax=Devosia sp. TaxID=1871048 RepID=UPI0024C83AFF|nr:hypothetical protein [Devosia sp.]UYN98379.1 MAG: hypothetical protein KIT02_10415 [Devosia sp.]